MIATSEATVTLNGKPRQVAPGLSLSALLDDLGIDRRLVAVAYNEQVIPRDTYDSVHLQDGDRVEVVRMVGGG
ncbi:MAG: sulfur carrier protein ThiS [Dehalococcoidia bacterium]|nr:sulfur carrier protein ThiS [Dehalococcoidia bacterium]